MFDLCLPIGGVQNSSVSASERVCPGQMRFPRQVLARAADGDHNRGGGCRPPDGPDAADRPPGPPRSSTVVCARRQRPSPHRPIVPSGSTSRWDTDRATRPGSIGWSARGGDPGGTRRPASPPTCRARRSASRGAASPTAERGYGRCRRLGAMVDWFLAGATYVVVLLVTVLVATRGPPGTGPSWGARAARTRVATEFRARSRRSSSCSIRCSLPASRPSPGPCSGSASTRWTSAAHAREFAATQGGGRPGVVPVAQVAPQRKRVILEAEIWDGRGSRGYDESQPPDRTGGTTRPIRNDGDDVARDPRRVPAPRVRQPAERRQARARVRR
jgi:hypothetical protein